MPTRLLVLPMENETEPDFLGSRPQAYRIKINYRDVAKVYVTASEHALSDLADKANAYLHPEQGELVELGPDPGTDPATGRPEPVGGGPVRPPGGQTAEQVRRSLEAGERHMRGEADNVPAEAREAERKGELPPGNQADAKAAKDKEGR